MAHIRDVRRLSITLMVVTGLLFLWYLFIRLQERGDFTWFLPDEGLQLFTRATWSWIVVALMALVAIIAGFLVFAIPVNTETGRAIGLTRQVQCQNCRAVFRLTDNGQRPLTHTCPSCNAYGVYDGSVDPVGEPPVPKPVRQVKKLDLTCKSCSTKFPVTDTGARPLRVECPDCYAVGTIR